MGKHSQRRQLVHSRWERKAIPQRTSGWLEEVTIEQCDSPQIDEADNDPADANGEDVGKDQNSRNVGELHIEEVDECGTKFVVHNSQVTKREKHQHCHRVRNKSSSSHRPPLEVWTRRTGRPSCPVNSERTILTERKTILYGQTPAAMCQIQLNAMAEAAGMSVSEFARHIMAGDTHKTLQLLREFHTPHVPQLTQLFDELDACALSESPSEQPNHGSGNFFLDDEALVENEEYFISNRKAVARVDCNTLKNNRVGCKTSLRAESRKCDTCTTIPSVSRDKNYLNNKNSEQNDNCLELEEVNSFKKNGSSVKVRGRKGFNLTPREVIMDTITVIPDTESDATAGSESDSEMVVNDLIPHVPQPSEHQLARAHMVKPSHLNRISVKSSSLLSDPPTLSTASLGFRKSQLREESSDLNSFERQQNPTHEISTQQTNKMHDSDYNTVLAGLFEDELSAPQVLESNRQTKIINNNSHNLQSDKTELCENNPRNANSTGYYNRVLDTLLFGECTPLPPLQSGCHNKTATSIEQTRPTLASSQDNFTASSSQYSSSDIDKLLFGSPPEEVNKELKGKVKQCLQTASDQQSQRPITLSQELSESPWATLGI
ncbi:uncharacterized protein [Procambarus clarkii]|uniref:uncharacterized protein n=1 Tax=Procambarus clarkii TaxID=6728 RepID=UPI001E678F2F|nr:uncharacterized protein LOC123756407 [Procambarus clarkii]XP_045595492.1 uncharacterized protein LOC123756407 [Procambarus clarkii]XP_045595493.1 uncharacterized protein LOC123756407 [Procambarus clarkii]XP_045595494.1 uncharacterized protein LOC123756407 [Procambarus clarkii]XP_045595495.1 uncharacterized protein LOC123756407 [Procambarus clarkii]XP_045595496.1 uncharacterized protein LOC123756407 [Procambarus clarkii]XP_045595497.1 uncharacterized protein LOC123756407 [Procambarus clarki